MTTQALKQKDAMKTKENFWIVNLVALLFMFGFGYVVKPFGPVSELGVSIVGIFIGVIIMTLFSNQMFYASLLGIGALVYHGYMDTASASAAFLGNKLIIQLIMVTAICGILKREGTMNVIAKKLLTNNALKGRPIVFVATFFLTTYIISMFLNFAPACILMFTLFESIREEAGYERKENFSKFMLVGTYISCMGSYAIPYMGIQLLTIGIIRGSLKNFGLTLTDGTYFITNVLIFAVFLIVYSISMGTIFKCHMNPLKNFDMSKSAALENVSSTLNKRQIIPIVTFLICILYSLLGSVLPKESMFHHTILAFGEVWIWVVAVAVLSILRVDGERFINGPEILKDNTTWNLLFLIALFSILGGTMTNPELGIKDWLVSLIGPLFGNLSLPLLIISVVLIVTIATQLLNGLPVVLATVAVVMPFTADIALKTGINVGVMGTIINVCAGMAFLTYSGSVWASLILSREEIEQKFIWSKGLMIMAIFSVITSILGIVLSYVL